MRTAPTLFSSPIVLPVGEPVVNAATTRAPPIRGTSNPPPLKRRGIAAGEWLKERT